MRAHSTLPPFFSHRFLCDIACSKFVRYLRELYQVRWVVNPLLICHMKIGEKFELQFSLDFLRSIFLFCLVHSDVDVTLETCSIFTSHFQNSKSFRETRSEGRFACRVSVRAHALFGGFSLRFERAFQDRFPQHTGIPLMFFSFSVFKSTLISRQSGFKMTEAFGRLLGRSAGASVFLGTSRATNFGTRCDIEWCGYCLSYATRREAVSRAPWCEFRSVSVDTFKGLGWYPLFCQKRNQNAVFTNNLLCSAAVGFVGGAVRCVTLRAESCRFARVSQGKRAPTHRR